VLLGKWFPPFQTIELPSFSGSNSPRRMDSLTLKIKEIKSTTNPSKCQEPLAQ